jgi:HAD superfamily hydrolase (TIGR01509 family)
MKDTEFVIFDNDGVLVDTELAANAVLAELLSSYGLPTTVEDSLRLYLGTSLSYVRSAAERRLGQALPLTFEADYHSRLFQALRDGPTPIPGVREALENLGLEFCVASSGSPERIERTLRMAGLWELFSDRAFSAESVGASKPAPDLFLHAAAEMGVEPANCIVVEDSAWGIQAANSAGMTSWGFAHRTPADRLSEATGGILRTMSDLGSIRGSSVWAGQHSQGRS